MKKLLILLAMCTGGYAMAQSNTSTTAANSTTSASSQDEVTSFIKKAAMADKMEIKAGKMAQQKAASPQVRSYGEMMVREHTNSSSELKTLAGKKNVTLPADMSSMDNAGASSSMSMSTYGQSTYTGTTDNSWANRSNERRNMSASTSKNSRGTANMRLSKAQTTPSKKYYNGVPTYWSNKDVNRTARSRTSNLSGNQGASNTGSMGVSGQDMTSGTNNISSSSSHSTTNNVGDPNMSSTSNTATTGVSASNMSSSSAATNAGVSSATSTSTNPASNSGATTAAAGANTAANTNQVTNEPGVSSDGNVGVSGTTGTLTANAAFNGATMGTDSTARTQNQPSGTVQSMGAGMAGDMTDMENDAQSKLSMLSQKSGAEFDRAYMEMMVNDHSKAIELYETASKSSDADVRAFATKMLPALKQHQEHAKTIKSSIDTGL